MTRYATAGTAVWPVPQHFPGPTPAPFFPPERFPPQPSRGRWEWIPYDDGMCDACRGGGICMCVRPGREPFCMDLPANCEVIGMTFTSSGSAIPAQH